MENKLREKFRAHSVKPENPVNTHKEAPIKGLFYGYLLLTQHNK